jgi:predicted 3-demethylubiquinone-9 3-methyltransferase (glyoxalase superfamily)
VINRLEPSVMSKISPCIWYATEAEEAARLYVSLMPDSRIDKVQRAPGDYPGGSAGAVLVVEFTLAGQSFLAMNGGTPARHSHALSLQISCVDQAEVDRLWDGLLVNGGSPQQCGWLSDRYGVNWQIIPAVLPQLLATADPAKAGRVWKAMMGMVKIDIAALKAAAAG